MKISVDVLDSRSIDRAIAQLEEYAASLDRKANILCERLAELGAWYAEWNFSAIQWTYSGNVDYEITVERVGDCQYVINAGGESVLFLEFGAGVTLGGGHPLEGQFGMGVGTYPGQKHAFDPKGWWFRQDGLKVHTYGNAAGMPVYNAAKDLRKEIRKIAQEVFRT